MNQPRDTVSSPKEVHTFYDEHGRAFGFLVIDAEIDGRACGGIRMAPDLSLDELCDLAQQMTLKFSFVGVGLGGAKSGIIGDPEGDPDCKEALLKKFGRAVAPWLQRGAYIPGVDFGTRQQDLNVVLAAAGIPNMPQVQPADRSGEATAFTIFTAMQAACDTLGLPLAGAKIGIEGFGGVGTALAHFVTTAGAEVVAVSTSQGGVWNSNGINIFRLLELQHRSGSACIREYKDAEYRESPTLAHLPLDVYAPCARTYSIDDSNVSGISAKLICGGSNLQAKRGVEISLHERSIFYVPPYVANCGGMLWGAMQTFGLHFSYFQSIAQTNLRLRVGRLFEEAIRQQKPPLVIADAIVAKRFQAMKAHAERHTLKRRIWQLGRAANNKGLIPRFIKQWIGQRQIMNSLGE
jgi:glutamate dehydrogenase/leucine dehydrogenase